MFWIVPTWMLSVLLAATYGYKLQNWVKRVEDIEQRIISSTHNKPGIEEPKSELIDVDDPIQTAIYERERMLKKLNPDE